MNTLQDKSGFLSNKAVFLMFAAFVALGASTGSAQVSLTGTPNPYVETFNSYRGSAATLPTGFSVGTGSYNGTGTGTGTAGGYYAFAPTGNTTDYSFGVLRSGCGVFTLASSFTNATGSTITSLTLTLDYEQYRFANTSGLDASGTGAISGQNVDVLDFTGSASGTTGTPAITTRTVTLNNLTIANGATFGFSFATTDAAGSDNALAIDNFSLSYTAVPEPATCLAGMLMLGVLGWSQRRRISSLLQIRCA